MNITELKNELKIIKAKIRDIHRAIHVDNYAKVYDALYQRKAEIHDEIAKINYQILQESQTEEFEEPDFSW